jgi:hypothetical protein
MNSFMRVFGYGRAVLDLALTAFVTAFLIARSHADSFTLLASLFVAQFFLGHAVIWASTHRRLTDKMDNRGMARSLYWTYGMRAVFQFFFAVGAIKAHAMGVGVMVLILGVPAMLVSALFFRARARWCINDPGTQVME